MLTAATKPAFFDINTGRCLLCGAERDERCLTLDVRPCPRYDGPLYAIRGSSSQTRCPNSVQSE